MLLNIGTTVWPMEQFNSEGDGESVVLPLRLRNVCRCALVAIARCIDDGVPLYGPLKGALKHDSCNGGVGVAELIR